MIWLMRLPEHQPPDGHRGNRSRMGLISKECTSWSDRTLSLSKSSSRTDTASSRARSLIALAEQGRPKPEEER